jgi:hypothetical protein
LGRKAESRYGSFSVQEPFLFCSSPFFLFSGAGLPFPIPVSIQFRYLYCDRGFRPRNLVANLMKYYTILQCPKFNSVSITYMAYFVRSLSLLWFEAAPSSGEFQEVEGESEERRWNATRGIRSVWYVLLHHCICLLNLFSLLFLDG